MTTQTNSARTHRFHNSVAVSIGTGETIYLDPATARELAHAIERTARDIDSIEFADSQCPTIEIEADGPRDLPETLPGYDG